MARLFKIIQNSPKTAISEHSQRTKTGKKHNSIAGPQLYKDRQLENCTYESATVLLLAGDVL